MIAAEPASDISGILNLCKPPGMTSHDVVARVRRLTGVKRVGHAGTLDPAAEGVLLLCLGAATRVSEYLMDGTKRYRAVVRLGATSDTDDSEGPIRSVDLPAAIGRDVFEPAFSRFVGDVEQVPPRFAAIKVGGRPLYDRARAGESFTPAARLIHIESIEFVDWQLPDLTIDVVCSKGTYIRALARDLGEALGSGAYLRSLVRTGCGEFLLRDSVDLDRVALAVERGELGALLHPIDRAVSSWPVVVLPDSDARRVANGESWTTASPEPGPRARAYDRRGHLVALLQRDTNDTLWRPIKVFHREGAHGAA